MKRLLKWIKDRLGHKLDHFRWGSIKRTMKKHGLALVIIIIGWEIVEDVVFPVLFVFLGNHVHPAFYAGAPAAWLLCLHWLAVPLMWSFWMRVSNKRNLKNIEHDCLKDEI